MPFAPAASPMSIKPVIAPKVAPAAFMVTDQTHHWPSVWPVVWCVFLPTPLLLLSLRDRELMLKENILRGDTVMPTVSARSHI